MNLLEVAAVRYDTDKREEIRKFVNKFFGKIISNGRKNDT